MLLLLFTNRFDRNYGGKCIMRYKMHSRDRFLLPRLPNDEVPMMPIKTSLAHRIETPPLCFVGGVEDFVHQYLKVSPERLLSGKDGNEKLQNFLAMTPVLNQMEKRCIDMIDQDTRGETKKLVKQQRIPLVDKEIAPAKLDSDKYHVTE